MTAAVRLSESEPERWHPLIFSAPMTRALLEGRKLLTRRIVAAHNSLVNGSGLGTGLMWPLLDLSRAWIDSGPWPPGDASFRHVAHLKVPRPDNDTVHRVYPRYGRGDRIWTKETFSLVWPEAAGDEGLIYDEAHPDGRPVTDRECKVAYAASGDTPAWSEERDKPMWKPSIYMPRWASRITLEVESVRPERLQDITAADIIAEGVVNHDNGIRGERPVSVFDGQEYPDLRSLWAAGWNMINAKRGPWEESPWVWRISFRPLATEIR